MSVLLRQTPRMSHGSPLLLRYPFLSTLIISAIISSAAVALSVVSYELIGQQNPGVSYEAISALGIAGLLAPTFLYPWIRTADRLRRASADLSVLANTDALTGLAESGATRTLIPAQGGQQSGEGGQQVMAG
jgi:hypothetical protein